jgi:DNA-binding NarL/FixJ family response regulator
MDPLESNPQMASSFDAAPTPLSEASRSPVHPSVDTPLRVYVVEDSPVIRENLIAALEEMLPVEVVGAADNEGTAVAWLRDDANACDLVTVDIFLKGGSGLGVLKALADTTGQRKVVVLSNYATPDMRRRCLELGADRVFDKSGDIEALLAYCEDLVPSRP